MTPKRIFTLNKSIFTNGFALTLVIVGFISEHDIAKTVGLFALSGALTNWIAVHMLFEKIPGLYGSGVIPEHFEDFKVGIRNLIMEQFFNEENIQRVLADNNSTSPIDVSPVIQKLDLSPAFDALIEVIKASSFGQMLGMFGGTEALEPMRQPFIEKMSESIVAMTQTTEFSSALQIELKQSTMSNDLHKKVSQIVEQRLDELTPQAVKEIIQRMIKEHLGWLVVWGGVFGGLIGLLAALFT
jgi:uncharacterized membrane protein YheB (UPF0754 family)